MAVTWPPGIRSAGVATGLKPSGERDLGVIVSERPVAWAGTFTANAAAAAPVRWSRARLGSPVRVVVVNSGNANACTGPDGDAAVEQTAAAAATAFECDPTEVLVASTGPIGIALPIAKVVSGVAEARSALSRDHVDFARAILTTDTVPKVARSASGEASIIGIAKGAAMLAPNMATMLSFVVTDAQVDPGDLQSALDEAVAVSFNRISVDACESTNDSVFLLSTGERAVPAPDFRDSLASVCRELALQMVRDAEGGSRVVRVVIEGAADDAAADRLARAVAASALWRAAVHGADPNWGRVLSALGSSDRTLELGSVEVAIGPEVVFSAGSPFGSLEAAAKAMRADEFTLSCRVGTGTGSGEVLTCDLSPEYVTLNAEGTS